ncbi:MAG: hypothetical protein ACQEP8_01330 [Chlamydiota bacterium]
MRSTFYPRLPTVFEDKPFFEPPQRKLVETPPSSQHILDVVKEYDEYRAQETYLHLVDCLKVHAEYGNRSLLIESLSQEHNGSKVIHYLFARLPFNISYAERDSEKDLAGFYDLADNLDYLVEFLAIRYIDIRELLEARNDAGHTPAELARNFRHSDCIVNRLTVG